MTHSDVTREVLVRYDAGGDTLTVQFASTSVEFHTGAVFDDVFVAFDSDDLGSPAVVRIASPFWGRHDAWTTSVRQLITSSVFEAGHRLAQEPRQEAVRLPLDAAEVELHRSQRRAFHQALCRRLGVSPPAASVFRARSSLFGESFSEQDRPVH
jgi:hypothetical protein